MGNCIGYWSNKKLAPLCGFANFLLATIILVIWQDWLIATLTLIEATSFYEMLIKPVLLMADATLTG